MTAVPVAIAHDYLTQRGGAERVAQIMVEAFPGAPLYTTLFERDATFPEFRELDVHTSVLNRVPALRADHRLGLALYAPVVSRMTVDADVLLASSSGWAHGMSSTGRKVVYCHAPARWLYQAENYLGPDEGNVAARLRRRAAIASLAVLSPSLRRWDRRQALTADRYLVNSSVIQRAVRDTYGIDAELLFPPPALDPDGAQTPVDGLDGPFVLSVARLLPYKNVDAVISAVARIDGLSLAVVGRGPDVDRLRALAGTDPDIHLLGGVSDGELRWLYDHCLGLVAASYEDFGLTPLEAAAFGKPVAALHAGGYLDTVDPLVNGLYFETPTSGDVRQGIARMIDQEWSPASIHEHAERFSRARFTGRLRDIVAEFG